MRRARLAAAAAVIVTGLCGCGGDDGGEPASNAASRSQPPDQFRAKADAICESVSAELAKTALPHSFPADIEEFDEKSKKVIAVIEQPFTELAAMAPPQGQEAAYARFASALSAAVAEAKQIRTLVTAGNDDTDALWLPRTSVETHQAQAMNQATELGLENCDELDYKEASH